MANQPMLCMNFSVFIMGYPPQDACILYLHVVVLTDCSSNIVMSMCPMQQLASLHCIFSISVICTTLAIVTGYEKWCCVGYQSLQTQLWRVRHQEQARAQSRLCCAAKASCGCLTATPLHSTGHMLASILRSVMRVTGECLSRMHSLLHTMID